jgi:actin-related protein
MPSSIRRIDVAGRDVTEYMQTLLRKSGYVFHTSAEKEVVRMIKEKVSYVAADPKREEKEWAAGKLGEGKMMEYVLPDGAKIKVILQTSCRRSQVNISRLALSASVPLKSSLTPKLLASSTQVSIKS